jgi:hypothetical protein
VELLSSVIINRSRQKCNRSTCPAAGGQVQHFRGNSIFPTGHGGVRVLDRRRERGHAGYRGIPPRGTGEYCRNRESVANCSVADDTRGGHLVPARNQVQLGLSQEPLHSTGPQRQGAIQGERPINLSDPFNSTAPTFRLIDAQHTQLPTQIPIFFSLPLQEMQTPIPATNYGRLKVSYTCRMELAR